jgi:hypothetical protein
LYKAGFRPTKVKVNTGLVEAEMERTPTDRAPKASPAEPASSPQFSQKATGGAVINRATIEAPADAPASARQEAEGAGSRLEDVRINIKK